MPEREEALEAVVARLLRERAGHRKHIEDLGDLIGRLLEAMTAHAEAATRDDDGVCTTCGWC